ncbi:MAG: protein BatD [bacterium]|nr:protein BatD [bacterium]
MMRLAVAILAISAAFTAGSATVRAGDLTMQVSTREAFVGEAVTVQIQVSNAEAHDPPEFPEVAGADVRVGQTRRNENVSIGKDGMTKQVTVAYNFHVTPRRKGSIVIPPVPVRVDGKVLRTRRAVILVTASETGDLLFVELVSPRESIYLGEALDVELEIWIRPYRDRNGRLDANAMLSRVDFDASQWGSFRDTVIQLRNGQKRWQYRNDTRVDSDGTQRAYFVYPIAMRFVPMTAGPLDVGEVGVVVSYPTRTGRRRDLFAFAFDRAGVTEARPVRATLAASEIVVQPPPEEGRPVWFNGAVGDFRISARAGNTVVRVREPIELTLTVSGSGVLDRVPAPPLNRVENLTSDFKVPLDVPAGIVEGGRKRFTVKIGAKSDAVTEIPSIPFSYFSPRNGQYATVWSRPIPLEVTPTEQVAVSQFVDQDEPIAPSATRLTETATGIRANYVDHDRLLAQQAFAPGWGSAAILLASPTAWAAAVVWRRRRDRMTHDRGYVRRRQARSTALAAMARAARTADPAAAVSALAVALVRYVGDRCNAPPGLTPAEALDELDRRSVAPDRIQLTESLLKRCEGLQYAGANSALPAELLSEAQRCVQQLERERF